MEIFKNGLEYKTKEIFPQKNNRKMGCMLKRKDKKIKGPVQKEKINKTREIIIKEIIKEYFQN